MSITRQHIPRVGKARVIGTLAGMPGGRTKTGLFQSRGQRRQIFAQLLGHTSIGRAHGYLNLTAAFRQAYFDALLSVSHLKLDVVRRRARRFRGWNGRQTGRRGRFGLASIVSVACRSGGAIFNRRI